MQLYSLEKNPTKLCRIKGAKMKESANKNFISSFDQLESTSKIQLAPQQC